MAYATRMKKIKAPSQHALDWTVIGWLATPGTSIAWTTHRAEDARMAFRRISNLLAEAVAIPVDRLRSTNGAEEIRLRNGSRVIFRGRGPGSCRGISADKLVLEDAGLVTESQLGAYLPVLAARPDPEILYA